MATIELTSHKAEHAPGAVEDIRVEMHFGGGNPIPKKKIEAKTNAEVQEALDAYSAEVAQTGQLCAVSMRVAGGRKPSGFDKAFPKSFYRVEPVPA